MIVLGIVYMVLGIALIVSNFVNKSRPQSHDFSHGVKGGTASK